MNRKILVIAFSILIIGGFFLLDRKKSADPHYEVIASQITIHTASILNEKYGLHIIGVGGGMMDNVKKMDLSLTTSEVFSVERGRELIISSVGIYLEQINTNERIRPFLNHYPFTVMDIGVMIGLEGKSGEDQLDIVSAHDGKIYYRVIKPKHKVETVLVETYEEARGIVMADGGS